MLWILMGAASASEPAVVETPTEPTVVETPATPSLLEEAKLSRLWMTSDDDGIAQNAAILQQALEEYSANAENVFIGEVVNMYHPGGHAINGTQVNLVVSEVIRGEVPSVTEIHVPPPGRYIDGAPDTAPIAIMTGFQMLVFTNADGETVTSNAMFLIDGGFIWRNKEPDVFLNPRNQRDWDLVDPSKHYLFASLTEVRQQLASR
jgi:hypothetical protein